MVNRQRPHEKMLKQTPTRFRWDNSRQQHKNYKNILNDLASEATSMFTTNILILGKTGVGKSSLLNYLFGDEVAAVGAGRPITGRHYKRVVKSCTQYTRRYWGCRIVALTHSTKSSKI